MNPKWRSCLVNAHKIGMGSASRCVGCWYAVYRTGDGCWNVPTLYVNLTDLSQSDVFCIKEVYMWMHIWHTQISTLRQHPHVLSPHIIVLSLSSTMTTSKVKIGVYDCDASVHPAKHLIGSCVTTFGELKSKQTKHAGTSAVRACLNIQINACKSNSFSKINTTVGIKHTFTAYRNPNSFCKKCPTIIARADIYP